MKGAFIVYGMIKEGGLDGIQKKILSQVRAFNENGLECRMKCIPRGDEHCGLVMAGFISLFPRMNWFPIWGKAEEYGDYDYIYLRRPAAMSFAMRKFLQEVRRINPGVRIVMEIPTYPYDGEMQSVTMRPFLWKDRYNRKRLQGLVDAFAVVSAGKRKGRIWGIPAITFQNGYDVSSVRAAKKPDRHDCIHLCCVAMFQPWHGYERLLLGMEKYYKDGGKREIHCHMVGGGGELAKYKRIAGSEYLKGKVIFHGKKTGEDLDRLYDKMDIGVCSLGSYKKGMDISGELKSREYMAKGIPMIVSGQIDVFQGKNIDFACIFENNSNPLNMEKIIKFYDKMQEKEGVRDEIRGFALQAVDMSRTMLPVINYIKHGRQPGA